MKKLSACVWLGAIAIAALTLFQMKHEVKRLEEALVREHATVLGNQEVIHVLKAEWSYLNQPARIAELAERHLAMQPLTVEQIVSFADLPLREEGDPEADPEAEPRANPGAEGESDDTDLELEAILASMRKRQ